MTDQISLHTKEGIIRNNVVFGFNMFALAFAAFVILLSINTQELENYVINNFIYFLIPFIILFIVNLTYNIRLIHRAYQFHKLNINPDTKYDPDSTFWLFIIPFLIVIRLPVIVSELLVNLDTKSKSFYIKAIYFYCIFEFITFFTDKIKFDNLPEFFGYLYIAIIFIGTFVSSWLYKIIFQRIYMEQNLKALEIEKLS
jgi:hypothetical protein